MLGKPKNPRCFWVLPKWKKATDDFFHEQMEQFCHLERLGKADFGFPSPPADITTNAAKVGFHFPQKV